ncbi:MAG: hypothetical protein OXF98_13875, partial [Rhodospirillaceae bacterium]|nr:hypothetical protein [Rhodospirillaceae bacterium]
MRRLIIALLALLRRGWLVAHRLRGRTPADVAAQRVVSGGLMAFVEYADPRAPVLHRVAHETVKLGSDNPDNYYQTAAIHGDFDY